MKRSRTIMLILPSVGIAIIAFAFMHGWVNTTTGIYKYRPLVLERTAASILSIPTSDSATLQTLDDFMRNLPDTSLGISVHKCILYGIDFPLTSDSRSNTFRSVIFDGRILDSIYSGRNTIYRTRFGARYNTSEAWKLAANIHGSVAAEESHPCQIAATLGACAIPVSQEIILSDGSKSSLAEVIDDIYSTFNFQGDALWEIMAILYYPVQSGSWHDRFGSKHDFNQIARYLLDVNLSETPCYGSHVMQAVSMLDQLDRRDKILDPILRRKIHERIATAVSTILNSSTPSGNIDPHWYIKIPGSSAPRRLGPLYLSTEVHSSGHQLEWISRLSPVYQIDSAKVDRLSISLLRTHYKVFCESPQSFLRTDFVCPATHSINFLSRRVVR